MLTATALAAAALFFDDFSHADVQALQQQGGWQLRTAVGHPGLPGARWGGISLVDDPERPGNRLLRMRAQTDGTPAGTEQAQLCHQRKLLVGTYAARVRFSDQPVSGADGDPIVQTFYAVAPLRHDFDPLFSEVDFEHLPNGGWGSDKPRLYAISWQTVRIDPWLAYNASHEEMGALNGWQELLIQVEPARVRHWLNGRLIHESAGRNVPVQPMAVQFNLWFSPGGLLPPSSEPRVWVQDLDWVLHVPDRSLDPAAVREQVARLRAAGVQQQDGISRQPLDNACNF